MSAKRPGAVRPALGRRRSLTWRDATDPAGRARDDERDYAVWLYAWSHVALRPTGVLLAARLTSRSVVRPGSKVGRISPHGSRRPWNAPDASSPGCLRRLQTGGPVNSWLTIHRSRDLLRGCSDPGAVEHLAGVLVRQSGVLERVGARRRSAIAEQPPVARVDVDRPLGAAGVADDSSAV